MSNEQYKSLQKRQDSSGKREGRRLSLWDERYIPLFPSVLYLIWSEVLKHLMENSTVRAQTEQKELFS